MCVQSSQYNIIMYVYSIVVDICFSVLVVIVRARGPKLFYKEHRRNAFTYNL